MQHYVSRRRGANLEAKGFCLKVWAECSQIHCGASVQGGFLLPFRIHPDDLYDWLREILIDSDDRIFVPNVYARS